MPKPIRTVKETESACLIQSDEIKNYYAFRVRDPSLFMKGSKNWASDPLWSRPIVASITTNAYIVLGRLKEGKHDWKLQSVRIGKEGRTMEQARSIALQIIEKEERRKC